MIYYDTWITFDKQLSVFGISKDCNNLKYKLKDKSKVLLNWKLRDEACIWCETHIGLNWIWCSAPYIDYTEFYFINEEDAILFKLRFGGR